MSENYSIQDYVDDLRITVAAAETESEILSKVRPLAQRLVKNRDVWIKPEHYQVNDERGSSLYVLHEEEDHTLMVFAACFRPGRVTPVHDHGTWAVVAGVDGAEKNTIYKRIDDGSKPDQGEIQLRGNKVVRQGDAIGMPSGTFHTVSNVSDEVSVSLHTYGMHINYTGRSKFDPEAQTQEEYVVTIED